MWQTSYPTAVGVVYHAHRSVLADRDGDESPATALAVVCHVIAVDLLFALPASGVPAQSPASWSGNQSDLRVVYMVTIARIQRRR
jgi:hypothetical protein